MKFPKLKIRCSAIGKIMGGSLDLGEAQENKLQELNKRKKDAETGAKGVKPLTPNMEAERIKLSDYKTLSDVEKITQGMKSYCEEWIDSIFFSSEKEINSKYIDKGNYCETAACAILADHYLRPIEKNEKYFENEYLTGTPDIILKEAIWDVKNSYDCFTFPNHKDKLENDLYYYQLQGYMKLTDRKKAAVKYMLMDSPDWMILREAKSKCWKLNLDFDGEEGQEVINSMRDNMKYYAKDGNGDYKIDKKTGERLTLESKYRIKSYSFDYNQEVVNEIERRVKVCREYIEILKERQGL